MVRRRFGQGICRSWGAISRTTFRFSCFTGYPARFPPGSSRQCGERATPAAPDPATPFLIPKVVTVGIARPWGCGARHPAAAARFGVDADEVLTPHLWLSVWRMHDRFCYCCSGVLTGLLVRHRPCGSRVGSRALVIRFRCGATPHSGVQQRPSRRGRGAVPAAGSGVRWDRRR